MNFNKRAQQEMIGFVLIVVLVIVALMIFIIISLNKPGVTANSRNADNLLSSLMGYTTECIVSQPDYDNVRDLIASCYRNEKCENLQVMACEYLNQSLTFMMNDITQSDATVGSYQLIGIWNGSNNEGQRSIFQVNGGVCNQGASVSGGGPESISVEDGTISVFLKFCSRS